MLSIMVSPINASKAVTGYKLPETTKKILVDWSDYCQYISPSRESTRSTNIIKRPNFLECSRSFASFCRLSSRNVKLLTVKGLPADCE